MSYEDDGTSEQQWTVDYLVHMRVIVTGRNEDEAIQAAEEIPLSDSQWDTTVQQRTAYPQGQPGFY